MTRPTLTTTLRLPPDLAPIVRVAAASRGQSVHAWVLQAIRQAILDQSQMGDRAVIAARERS